MEKSKIFLQFLDNTKLLNLIEPQNSNHNLKIDDMMKIDHDNSHTSQDIKNWRQNLNLENYQKLKSENKKEIFDYFFRDDLYGKLYKNDINMLSRGVNDPAYFEVPSIIKIALNKSAQNNWFGYSDSLGHIETRKHIAALEKNRRGKDITFKEIAVTQGNTSSLDSILSFISRQNFEKKNCILITPTYYPILDNVTNYFNLEEISLDQEYQIDYDNLKSKIDNKNCKIVLFSIPHNPYGNINLKDSIEQIHDLCQKQGSYLIIDEIVDDKTISPYLNPIKYPNLIVLSSYSKKYNIPGLKLGHIIADKNFLDKFYRHASTTYGSPPSFLYFVLTAITNIENAYHYDLVKLNEELNTEVSEENFLSEDFDLWNRFNDIQAKYQNFLLKLYQEKLNYISFEKLYGMQDPSPNIVIQHKKTTKVPYRIMLEILADEMISVMPIECFSPEQIQNNDFRLTISNNPLKLGSGLFGFGKKLDEIYIQENKNKVFSKDEINILKSIGLFDKSYNSWSNAYRTYVKFQNNLSKININEMEIFYITKLAKFACIGIV